MTQDMLGRLEAAHEALIAALDGGAIDDIELRLDALREAVEAVRAAGAWHDSRRMKERAQRIVQLGEAARIRVNFLTDMTRQRLQMLAAARGDTAGIVYLRPGHPAAAV